MLTGGGTAGHVTPHIALIPSLKKNGWDIQYIGSHQGIERELITKEKIPYYGIASGKLRRYLSIQNLKDPFKVVKGFFDAYKILKKLKPRVVFSKGGYVTVPVVMAANVLKIPVVLHESDITPGLANKIAIKGAKIICVNFEETLKYVGPKGILTGSPIRKSLFEGSKERGNALCSFKDQKPILLMMGGSLGSLKMNAVLRKALPVLLKTFNIIHICGKGNIDPSLRTLQGYRQFEYVEKELPDLFAITELMLSRAGANSLSEIVALHIPTLLIPLSQAASRGDQILNAESMKRKGYCEVLEEEKLDEEILIKNLEFLYKNRSQYKKAMQQATQIKAIDKIIEILNNYR